jgi:hypothetical protein
MLPARRVQRGELLRIEDAAREELDSVSED